MLRKLVLGLTLAIVTAMGSAVTAGSAHAGALTRVKNAVRVGIEGDVRAARDLAHGNAKQAARDVVAGAEIGVSFLKGGGGGFGNKK
jgi:hypothetical protein